MLSEITIENLGVIHASTAELSGGLTVLTGETGAGKTMVVTGLRLLAGGRADASRVRSGAERAVVEGRFVTDGVEAADVVEAAGGQPDENGEFIATRTVAATGRSKAYLGGRAVPAATLSQFASEVLTVHGQNDQLRLLAPDQQLAALDRSDPELLGLRESYADSYRRWRALAKDYKQRTQSRRELAQEVDQLQFAINEIENAAPQPGEDVELVTQIRRLQDVDALREAASQALQTIDGAEAVGGYSDEQPASTLLGRAHDVLGASEDEDLKALGDRLGEITSQLADIAVELGGFLSGLPADPQVLETSLQRQQELKVLTRKYAPDIDGVLAWQDKAQKRLAAIDTSSEALDKLKAQLARAEADMVDKATVLTAARRTAADKLSKAVTRELHGLAMPKARLEVVVRTAKYSTTGADEVELMLAPNDVTEAKPLANSASGGELSRVMLALEVILASDSEGATLVFDEVDAGVGGRAAVEIGRRLARLAVGNQVIVVTHLPQVAAYATTHLHVAKEVSEDSVVSGVIKLNKAERVEELARMLAGLDDTETGRAHAAELFQRAQAEVGRQA